MSKRIREPFYSLLWKASIGYNDSWSDVDPEVLEKFAELIVSECAAMTRNLSPHGEHAEKAIKEHFGVG